jgi:hypothetical protein
VGLPAGGSAQIDEQGRANARAKFAEREFALSF